MIAIFILVVFCLLLSGLSVFGLQFYRQKDLANLFKKNVSTKEIEKINELEKLLKKEKTKVKNIKKELKMVKEQCELY